MNEIPTGETSVFPYTSTGAINILSAHNLAQVLIYDMSGRVVYIQTLQSGTTNATLQLQLAPGTYLLKSVSDDGRESVNRIIIER